MPSLAFSRGPQNPPPHGGEKENANGSFSSTAGGVTGKNIADPSPRRRSSGASAAGGGRLPLESLSPDAGEAAVAAVAAGGAAPPLAVVAPAGGGGGGVVCKRNSSCKCPDCDMAASVFGIDELRQLGGGGGGGGVVASPLPGAVAAADGPATVKSGGPVARSPVSGISAAAAPGTPTATAVAAAHDGTEEDGAPGAAVGVAAAPPTPAVAPRPPRPAVVSSGKKGTPVAPGRASVKQNEVGVADGSGESGSKKKAGWGFRMARAVFSPGTALSPKKKAVEAVVAGEFVVCDRCCRSGDGWQGWWLWRDDSVLSSCFWGRLFFY